MSITENHHPERPETGRSPTLVGAGAEGLRLVTEDQVMRDVRETASHCAASIQLLVELERGRPDGRASHFAGTRQFTERMAGGAA